MVKSVVKEITDAVAVDLFKINHNFGSGYTLKIIEINPSLEETVLIEIEASPDKYVNLKADITDNFKV